jgi:hypothetical protein
MSDDPMQGLFVALGRLDSALTAAKQERERQKAARRRSPEALAARSAAAHRGWEGRREREAADRAADELSWGPEPAPADVRCYGMTNEPATGGGEVYCILERRHKPDCTDGSKTWDRPDEDD